MGKLGSGVALNLGSRSSRRGKQPAQRYLYRYSISNLVLSFLLFHRPVFSPKFTALDSDTTFHSVGERNSPPAQRILSPNRGSNQNPTGREGKSIHPREGREGRGGREDPASEQGFGTTAKVCRKSFHVAKSHIYVILS